MVDTSMTKPSIATESVTNVFYYDTPITSALPLLQPPNILHNAGNNLIEKERESRIQFYTVIRTTKLTSSSIMDYLMKQIASTISFPISENKKPNCLETKTVDDSATTNHTCSIKGVSENSKMTMCGFYKEILM